MAIPWLIGAAVIAVGKVVYDSYEEDERQERAERRARREERAREEEASQKREDAIKKEEEKSKKERELHLKKYAVSQVKVILEKYNIVSLSPEILAKNVMLNPEQALDDINQHYMNTNEYSESEKKIKALEIDFDELSKLRIILQGI